MNRPTCIDLFAGAGGLSHGFSRVGFAPLFANEHEQQALDTYRANHPRAQTSAADIETLDPLEIAEAVGLGVGELTVLLGGPPCQGFSTYGQRDPGDPRNRLPEEYLRFLEALRPEAFVMENVLGLLSMQGGALIEHIRTRVSEIGYTQEVFTLDASDYGVPQRRRRAFVIGFRDGAVPSAPRPTHVGEVRGTPQGALFPDSRPKPLTVRDAISDLVQVPALAPSRTQEAQPYGREPDSDYQAAARVGSAGITHHSA